MTVGDVCRALDVNVLMYCDVLVPKLLEVLRAPAADAACKTGALGVLGDAALATEEAFFPYMHQVLDVVMLAASVPLPDGKDDYDLIEDINKLRESVLEAITGIIQGMKKSPEHLVQGLQPHAANIIEFLKTLATEEDTPPEVLKAATGVLGDMCDGLMGHIKPLLNQPHIMGLCERCMGDAGTAPEVKELAQWTVQKVQAVLQMQ